MESALVASAEDAAANILRFVAGFEQNGALQERVTLAHDWYAVLGQDAEWAFGFSKFVGYQDNNATRYLRMARGGMSGANTENRLKKWFAPVDLDTPLGRELSEAHNSFLARRSRVPRKSIRICALKSELGNIPETRQSRGTGGELLARISFDPRICGGRPCIKGTRMRVSDIVDMLAHGAAREEVLQDFPYLAEEDIAAALANAARATDHRVIRAA